MSNNDIGQKLMLMQLLWSWNYLPHLEVKLTHPEGSSYQMYELTDVDVFGIRMSDDLSIERIIGDCKTLKSVSAINRAFWLRGVMEYFKANRGYLILKMRKSITEDHKLGAKSMGITLMSEDDFGILFSKLISKNFQSEMRMFQEESWSYLEQNIGSAGFAKRINEYRRYQYWIDTPSRSLRYCLFEALGINEKIDPKQKFHAALILDMITLFSVSFQNMVSHLFHVYLIPERKADMDDYLKAFVYGGRETYTQVNRLNREVQKLDNYLSRKQTHDNEISDISLPEWEQFLHLFRTVLDNPTQFRDVPRLLRFVLFERLLYSNEDAKIEIALPNTTTHTIKFSIDVVDYFLKASRLTDKLWQPLSEMLVATLVELQGNDTSITPKLANNVEE